MALNFKVVTIEPHKPKQYYEIQNNILQPIPNDNVVQVVPKKKKQETNNYNNLEKLIKNAPIKPKVKPTSYNTSSNNCIIQSAESYNINPYLLYAIAKVESGFDPNAINYDKNGTADLGMFQINTANLDDWHIPYQYAFNVCYGAQMASYVLRKCIDDFGVSWKAIDCYNKGARNAHNDSMYVYKVYKALLSLRGYHG